MLDSKKCRVKKCLETLGLIFLSFLFITSFQSKALINIFLLLSLLNSIIYIIFFEKRVLIEKKYIWLFIAPYLLGFILGFLSESGAIGSIEFLQRFKFMVILLPLACFVKSKKEMIFLLAITYISALIAILYGIYKNQHYGNFHGFHSIGRTADMLVILLLSSLAYLVQSRFTFTLRSILEKTILLGAVFTFSWAIIMTEMRGAWLGMSVGLFFLILGLFILKKKILGFSLLVLIIATGVIFLKTYNNADTIKKQVVSISDTQENTSNKTRLDLWKTGWDFSKEQFFFGTGAKQSKDMFINFFNNQEESYQKKYKYAMNHPGDYHNSYLQIYIETGIIFFIIYISSISASLLYFIKRIQKIPFENRKYPLAAIVGSLAFLSIQFFHNELYSYGATVFYLTIFASFYVLNENEKTSTYLEGNKDE